MKKILFIQDKMVSYRVPLFNEIGKNVEHLTVCHFGDKILNKNFHYFEEKTFSKKKFGGWYLPSIELINFAAKFDIIVGSFNIRWLNICILPFVLKNKFYFWGIGLSSAYGLNKKKFFNIFRFWIGHKANGIIFYSNYPKKIYLNNNFNEKNLHVAHNTIKSKKINLKNRKFEKFLFFGSLHHRKKISTLLRAFSMALPHLNNDIYLEIVGGGNYMYLLKREITELNLKHKVKISGPIYDSQQKKECFKNAIATISPGQAGLSVLESMSYGVPFTTMNNAITGGEIFNIIDKKNGFLFDTEEELKDLLVNLSKNQELQTKVSYQAHKFFWSNRTMKNMAQSFIEVFEE